MTDKEAKAAAYVAAIRAAREQHGAMFAEAGRVLESLNAELAKHADYDDPMDQAFRQTLLFAEAGLTAFAMIKPETFK
jgi:hypothetical protein